MVDREPARGFALEGLDATDVAQRHLGILRMIAPTGWLRAPTEMQRTAALVATGVSGDSALVADRAIAAGDAFAKGLPFWVGLRGDIRIAIGTFLVAFGLTPEDALALRQAVRRRYRDDGAGYVEPHAFLAALVHRRRTGPAPDTALSTGDGAVTRIQASIRLLRQRYWFSYYHDVAPLLAAQPGSLDPAERFAEKLRRTVQRLKDAGFPSYADRLRTALILLAAGPEPAATVRLMEDWRQGLKGQPLPHKRLGSAGLALMALGWGSADREGLEAMARLYGGLRHGRPKADPATAVNSAAALLARMGPAQGRGPLDPDTAFFLFDAQAASLACAEGAAASQEDED
ncbi:MAG: hypothetical protein ACFB6R_14700 [Alphaproteobacteria bacterium]